MRLLRLMVRPLRHYADFAGTSSLKEFWAYSLLIVILSIPAAIADLALRSTTTLHEPVTLLGGVLLWFPNFALIVRRLHSFNLSGLWLFTPIGFMLLGLLTNGLIGDLGWGRYATSLWTIAMYANALAVMVVVTVIPARVTDD